MLLQTPGVSYVANGPPVGGTISVLSRGYSINNYQIDGMPTSREAIGYAGAVAMDTAIYDSVTVVRGATGLLTGAGDPSGSISLTRKQPTNSFQASVEQSLGRWQQRRTVGDVGGPLNAAGTLRGRLVAAYDEGDSWIDRYSAEKSVVYGVLAADLGSRTTLNLALEHGRENADGSQLSSGFGIAFTDGSQTPFSHSDNGSADWASFKNKRTAVSAALEHRINNDWQASLTYSHTRIDRDHRYGMAGWGNIPVSGVSTILMGNFAYKSEVDSLAAKLNGSYTLWGKSHELVAGFNASDADLNNPVYGSMSVPDVPVLDWNGSYPEPDWSTFPNNPYAERVRQSGLYVATRLSATDDPSFIIGGRWSNWKTKRHNLNTRAITDEREESMVFTPYAAVTYNLTPQLSAYVSYTTIFNPQNYKDFNGRMLDPTEGQNVEFGLKGEWFDGRMNTSAAIFQSGKDNLAVRDGDLTTPDGGFAYRAEDDTKGSGWELEASGELLQGWQIHGGYTRMVLEDSKGARLNTGTQHKHLAKLFTTWKPAGLNGLTVGGGVLWQSEIYDTSNPLLRSVKTQKSYAVVNLMASYAFNKHLRLSLNLGNVFDKSYRTLPGYHVYGAPRNIHASLKYQF